MLVEHLLPTRPVSDAGGAWVPVMAMGDGVEIEDQGLMAVAFVLHLLDDMEVVDDCNLMWEMSDPKVFCGGKNFEVLTDHVVSACH